ncbi:probable linoleate 9S-lipoxygenase 5 [Benincasa hispida]|uniref:probable linoleate 9S-lipoxygenase 5 n=1 Tax=Benincasa hispida TaxID=102211 RepID=UPI001902BD57|nr:probable linoleate 9S-lipoxygenase 5 [Benincasa hispida]
MSLFRRRKKVKGVVVLSEGQNIISGTNEDIVPRNQSIDISLPEGVDGINHLNISTSSATQVLHGLNRAVNGASRVVDKVSESLGGKVSLQLISSTNNSWKGKGKVGKKVYLEKWSSKMKCGGDFVSFEVNFKWDEEIGLPGAFIIKNRHLTKFYLKSFSLENVPHHGNIHFDCNSWIYPFSICPPLKSKRIFFTNKAYLPQQTPEPLLTYRNDELIKLRGDGTGERQKRDRIYDYDVYNDLDEKDLGSANARQILGNSTEYPYPRRGRTGRGPSLQDGRYESRSSTLMLKIYVPSNERFGPSKRFEFFGKQLDAKLADLHPSGVEEFESFQDVLKLYELLEQLKIHRELPKIPLPQLIQENKFAWRTDEEFAREMLAGENPIVIRRLKEFPPLSKLDQKVYGDQDSKITEEHVINSLDGYLTVNEAMKENRLYILDHHDSIIPFLRRINSLNSTKTYATRTILFLKDDGTLKPLAIELSLPHPDGDKFGAISRVVLAAKEGVDASIWQLAKAYVAVNDTGHHQLVSHWLNTHAVIEPFVIATNRQLSVLHPIHKLLVPHFKDTMKINALARESLISANGIIERTHYPAKYSMEMSSFAYKTWVFPQQALPADLIERGIAIKDPSAPHGVQLLIEDYPYAVDGLEIWTAIKTWVQDYCSFYYQKNEMICDDQELQSWWKELREKGHEDKKNETWWPNMQTLEELVEICTIIIWISSALHAAVNFGQYSYGGFFPNRPTISTRLLPDEGTPDYEELELHPEKAFLKTISSQRKESISVVSIIAILSMHFSDEVYLGERSNPEWTWDKEALEAFDKFRGRLKEIEERILKRNKDPKLKNRVGPVNVPYTLLFPTSTNGLTGKGIPNSISI